MIVKEVIVNVGLSLRYQDQNFNSNNYFIILMMASKMKELLNLSSGDHQTKALESIKIIKWLRSVKK